MTSLRRTLGTTDLVLLVVGSVIGSGVFIIPSFVLQQAGGDISIASLIWLLGGVLSLLGALAVQARERGWILVTRDRDFEALRPLVAGLRVVAPFPERPES